ncbi:MAG: hypothetical protein IT293_19710 [Deltaproteobacteria bacterium]|nr:hypothetical protein [Deltaproteobacteria bacterium]
MQSLKLIVAGVLALGMPAPAGAQFATPADSACIQAVNAGVRKVALATSKQLRACAGYAADGLLGPQSVADCAAALAPKAVAQALLKADRECGGVPPTFGPPSITAPPALTVAACGAVVGDLFGPTPESAFVATANVRACQGAVLKAMRGCVDARLSGFNRCKKEGLKRGFVRTAAELRDACLGTGAEQPDPSGGTIAKRCAAYVASVVESKCVAGAVALDAAFPGCGTGDAGAFRVCFDGRIRCRVCALLNAADGLTRDCDLFDDGDDGNASCS